MDHSATSDTEKGSEYERTVLAVQGMSCSGCERKVLKTLQQIRGIQNVKTSLVLALVEFDLNAGITSVETVADRLRAITGYTYEVMDGNADLQDIVEITFQGNETDAVKIAAAIPGVQRVWIPSRSSPSSMKMLYSPAYVGPRAILEIHLSQISARLAPASPHPSISTGRNETRRLGLVTIAFAVLTVPILVFTWGPFDQFPQWQLRIISCALASIIQCGIAWEYYPGAFKSMFRSKVVEMEVLISLSTTAAYVLSLVFFGMFMHSKVVPAGERPDRHYGLFFETSALLSTLVMSGRFISEFARHGAMKVISIRSLQPQTATLVEAKGVSESSHSYRKKCCSQLDGPASKPDTAFVREIDIRLLQKGDVFRVLPHCAFPTDGEVICGSSEVDESMMTGEPVPVPKLVGSTVIAGSINGNGSLDVAVKRLPRENTITRIASMVDGAELAKPRIQAIADKIAGYFVPTILAVTLLIYLIWFLVGICVKQQRPSQATVEAIEYAITTLVISCPCAIGLAVPMVVVIANGVAAKNGIIFKSSQAVETASKVTDVIFDKTGTLTRGEMTVMAEHYASDEHGQIESIVLGLVQHSNHPVARAVCKLLHSRGVRATGPACVEVIPGCGIQGIIDGIPVKGGSPLWLSDALQIHPFQLPSQRGYPGASFCVIVAEAVSVINELRHRGLRVHILSGDSRKAVQDIALRLGIDTSNAKGDCSPANKLSCVKSLIAGDPRATILFCGDGTNDAPALTQAHIGVHVNSSTGTEMAKASAAVVLVQPDLYSVLKIIDISSAAYRRIMFNFGWCFAYNLFAILMAAGAFVEWRVPPAFAGLGEAVSVLPVIFIAFTLKWKFVKVPTSYLEVSSTLLFSGVRALSKCWLDRSRPEST